MRRAERLAAGGDAYEVVEVDATGEQSLADSASGLASDDANEWLLDESVLEHAEAPGPCVVRQEHRVEWVVDLGCRRVRPDEPRRQDNRHVPGGARVRLQGIIFGGLRPVPTDPSIDPPPYHCFNCWQPDRFSGQCPRPRVRIYCRNCGRHGEDLNSRPRCGEDHAEFLRRNFGGERRYERELEQRGREALTAEQQRAEETRRRQFLAEQE